MKPFACRILFCNHIIHLLLGVSAFRNTRNCTYEKQEGNPYLTLPATVTYTHAGVITSQTECATECCYREVSCAGFTYEMGSKTCLMAVKVIISMCDMSLFDLMRLLTFFILLFCRIHYLFIIDAIVITQNTLD